MSEVVGTVTCTTCRYADPTVIDDVDGPDAAVECRRYPPTMIYDGEAAGAVWPVVESTDWCGEHVPREDYP